MINEIKARGLVVGIDIEGKSVNRLKSFYPLSKDAVDFRDASLDKIYAYNYEIAKYVKSLGIDIIFGPVTDVCNAPQSFLYRRCYSEDVKRTRDCALTVLKAYQDAGILGCLKHLPGHGKAIANSHKELPIVHESAEELYKNDIAVSKSIIDAIKSEKRPLPAGMVAHIVYENLDPKWIILIKLQQKKKCFHYLKKIRV